jgi:hypothetical protein
VVRLFLFITYMSVLLRPPPNQRLKLSARGGRLVGMSLSCLRPPQAAA